MHPSAPTCFYCNLSFCNGATVRISYANTSQSVCICCLVRNKWLRICTVRTLFMNVRNRLGIPLWHTCRLVCAVGGIDVRMRTRPTEKLIDVYLNSISEYFRMRSVCKSLVAKLPIPSDLCPLVWSFLYPKNIAV